MRSILLSGAFLSAAAPAFAAETVIPVLPTVVVTPQRFDAAPANLPASISVIDRDAIEHSTAATLPDLLAREAGIHVRDNSGSPDKQIDLRGFGITGDRNTLILLDGQRLSEIEIVTPQLSTIPLDSIERIEILRGSGAVLYGGGATGGVINIITRAPKPGQREAYVAAGYGSYGTAQVRAGGIVGTDKLGLSLHANHLESDNYRDNNQLRQDNIEGDLRLNTGPIDWKLRFGGDDQHLRLPGSRTEAQVTSDPRGTSSPNDYSTRNGKHIGLEGSAALGRADISADVSYRERNAAAFFAPSYSLDTHVDVVTASLRAKIRHGLFGLASASIVGLDVDDWDYRQDNSFGGHTPATQKNRAIFLQNQTDLGAATHVTLGGRTQLVRETQNDLRQSRAPNAYEIGLRHDWSGAFSTYARYGRSFRIATVDENNFQVALLEPQTSHDMEIGAEYRFASGKLGLAVFRNLLTNEIYFQRLAGFFGNNVNLSPTERRGVELQGEWAVTRSLNLTANYSYTEATFREGVYGGVKVSGNDIPLVPRNLANLGVDWRWTTQTRLRADAQYVGKQRYDNDQANDFGREIPSYVLVDTAIFHDIDAWRLSLGVRNLFDEKYYSYGIRSLSTPTFNAYPEPRRTYFVSAEYRFK